jgi:hypothetical protein
MMNDTHETSRRRFLKSVLFWAGLSGCGTRSQPASSTTASSHGKRDSSSPASIEKLNVSALMKAFNRFPKDLAEYRDTPELLPVFRSLPPDPEAYRLAVSAYLPTVPDGLFRSASPKIDLHFRLEQILRELLFHDGRTFNAILCIVDWANEHPGNVELGMNPLGWVYAYFQSPRHIGYTKQELLQLFDRYMKNKTLAGNADSARNCVLRWPEEVETEEKPPDEGEPRQP